MLRETAWLPGLPGYRLAFALIVTASLAAGDPSYADFIADDTAAPKVNVKPKPRPDPIVKSKPFPTRTPSAPAPMSEPFSSFFISDNLPPGAQVRMYPADGALALLAMTDAVTFGKHPSLEIQLKAYDYSGCSICAASSMDMQPFYQTGRLEFWVRGGNGGEVFNIGLLDDGENEARRPLQVWVNARTYATVSSGEWSRVRVPFASLGLRGSYWNPEAGGPLFSAFNWTGVRCLTLDIDKGRQKDFRIWMAGARLIRADAQEQPPQHPGYVLRNGSGADSQVGGVDK